MDTSPLAFPLLSFTNGVPRYNRSMKAILLGTSSAWPIPRPGCACAQCEEARGDAREARSRSGLYLETGAGNLLVDVSPDIIAQLERAQVAPRIDAVILTHHHADHVLGLGDLCHVRVPSEEPLSVYAGPKTRAYLRAAFAHLLRPEAPLVQLLDWHCGRRLMFAELVLEGFETGHREDAATTGVLLEAPHEGRRVRLAYATDMGFQEPSPAAVLRDVDVFVGDGTYLAQAGYGHPTAAETIQCARDLGARKIVLTHVGHWRVDRQEALAALPADVAVCRDGDDLFSFVG